LALVARALGDAGRALPHTARTPMPRAPGFDFANVRVHDDAAAHAAAGELGARALSWGEHVILGRQAGRQTLLHELAHVAQQRGAPADSTLRPAIPDEALERDADRAVRTGQGPALNTPVRMVQMQAETEPQPFRLPEPRPGESLARPPASLVTGQLEFRLMPEDRKRIDEYLSQHAFGLIKLRPALDGSIVTMDEIVERLRPLVLPIVGRDKIETYVEGKVRAMVLDALLHPRLSLGPPVPTQLTLPLPAAPATQAPPRVQGWQTVLAAGGQIAWHVNVATGRPAGTPQDVTMQFQAARSFAAHPANESGSELQGLVQFGYNVTNGQVTVLSGAQFTEVFSLFNGLLQLGGFAQLLAGVAAGGGSVSGQIQPSTGLQALVQIGPIQFGAQIFQGATLVPGGEGTRDRGVAGLFQYSF
jgi:hypothetical protein